MFRFLQKAIHKNTDETRNSRSTEKFYANIFDTDK